MKNSWINDLSRFLKFSMEKHHEQKTKTVKRCLPTTSFFLFNTAPINQKVKVHQLSKLAKDNKHLKDIWPQLMQIKFTVGIPFSSRFSSRFGNSYQRNGTGTHLSDRFCTIIAETVKPTSWKYLALYRNFAWPLL